MRKAIKKQGQITTAFRLGEKNDGIEALIAAGRIRVISSGLYEVFSQEATNGKGEVAKDGDYIKVDSTGSPYPNTSSYFEANHKWIRGDEYEQIPVPVDVWLSEDPMCKEIAFLIKAGRLEIRETDNARYFNALLWGTQLSAARDAAGVIYKIERNSEGEPIDIDFNFVERREFEKTYSLL